MCIEFPVTDLSSGALQYDTWISQCIKCNHSKAPVVPPTTVIVPEKEQEELEWRMRHGLILQEFVATVQAVSPSYVHMCRPGRLHCQAAVVVTVLPEFMFF